MKMSPKKELKICAQIRFLTKDRKKDTKKISR